LKSKDKEDLLSRSVLRVLLSELSLVNLADHNLFLDESSLLRLVRSLPAHNVAYASLLWLSYLVVMQKGLTIEHGGMASFDTFVVSMADIFEDYTREVIHEHFNRSSGYSVKNGNIDQVDLFVDNSKYKVKPDIYIQKGRVSVAVLDAKYKPNIKPADRYEIIAFCEALHVKLAVVISPAISSERLTFLGETPSGIRFWQVTIDLGAANIAEEQRAFLKHVEDLLTGVGDK